MEFDQGQIDVIFLAAIPFAISHANHCHVNHNVKTLLVKLPKIKHSVQRNSKLYVTEFNNIMQKAY